MEKPNFYMLGAAKAGTTTLYDLLSQHPQIFLTFDKEPMFFSRDDYYARGIDWYLNTFYTNSEDFPARGEASPHYLYWADKVAQRIYHAYGDKLVKFIVILRNPIERAYSWYWNMIADGRENNPFFDALKMENQRMQDNYEKFRSYGSMQYGYLRGGAYSAQIQAYLQLFQKEQFLFLLQDDLKQNSDALVQQIYRFLGVSPDIDIIARKSNSAGLPRSRRIQQLIRTPSAVKDFIKPFIPKDLRHQIKTFLLKANKKQIEYPEMSNDAHKFLAEYYQEEIAALSDLLKRDLSAWRE